MILRSANQWTVKHAELVALFTGYIRKALEQHKLGINREKLADVRVVGVTCAASVFPYLERLTFQVQLLDECSQMMEALSLLPIARFKCEKLVLVGDPNQLPPTIQGDCILSIVWYYIVKAAIAIKK